MKFIHLSNVRLGEGAPKGFPFPFDRKQEIYEDFYNVLKICGEQQVDALFITGNLFDHVPTTDELDELDNRFAELQNTRVFYLTGRMDAPGVPTQAAAYHWKSNTTVFAGSSIDRVYAPKLNCEITGVGYSPKTWDKVQIQHLERGNRAAIQILLLPFVWEENSDKDLGKLTFDFDYVGLGQKVLYKGNGKYPVYAPGIFEPTGFTTQVHHGFFLCSLTASENGQLSLTRQFVQGVKREYMTLKVNCTKDLDIDQICNELAGTIRRYGTDHFYNIVLSGELSYSAFSGKGRLYELGNVIRVEDETDEEELIETLKADSGSDAVSRFINQIMKADHSEVRENALKAGLDALIGLNKRTETESK